MVMENKCSSLCLAFCSMELCSNVRCLSVFLPNLSHDGGRRKTERAPNVIETPLTKVVSMESKSMLQTRASRLTPRFEVIQ